MSQFTEKPLEKYRANRYSQNGEDGVIRTIFDKIGLSPVSKCWCVEFGAWDGKYLSNTYALVEQGWNAVYIEGDIGKYQDLIRTSNANPNIIPLNSIVSADPFAENSLDNLLQKTAIPKEFDLLSIDIDSFDLDVWEGLTNYLPNVVIIEIKSSIPPGIYQRHSKKLQGNSFSSTLEVAREKGYDLVCHTGNMIFVHKGLVKRLGIYPRFLKYPSLLFDEAWL